MTYWGRVEIILARIQSMDPVSRIDAFVEHLPSWMKLQINLARPRSVSDAANLALKLEVSQAAAGGSSSSGGGRGNRGNRANVMEGEAEPANPTAVANQPGAGLAAVSAGRGRPPSRWEMGTRTRVGPDACYRCGEKGHYIATCPLKEDVCHYCKQKGHWKKDCKQRNADEEEKLKKLKGTK